MCRGLAIEVALDLILAACFLAKSVVDLTAL